MSASAPLNSYSAPLLLPLRPRAKSPCAPVAGTSNSAISASSSSTTGAVHRAQGTSTLARARPWMIRSVPDRE